MAQRGHDGASFPFAEREKGEKKSGRNISSSPFYDIRHIRHDIRHAYIPFRGNTIVSETELLLPCEVAVRSLVPAIRSALARELTQTHGLKQKDVANLLGVTQTAVSKYTRRVRGTVLRIEDVEEVQATMRDIVVSLANGRMSKYELVARFCAVCEIIRRKGLMCELCRLSDPEIEIHQCFVCHSNPQSSLVGTKK